MLGKPGAGATSNGPCGAARLGAESDDRYLSPMSRRVFSAGLKQAMVRAKWPAFEEVILGFDPGRVRAIDDEDLEGQMNQRRCVAQFQHVTAASRQTQR